MTVLQAIEKLTKWFESHNSFNFKEDYLNLILIEENALAARAGILCGLNELEKTNFLSSAEIDIKCEGKKIISIEKQKYWVLRQPLNQLNQTLILNGVTCNLIATVINEYCKQIKDEKNLCNPLNITNNDINNLLGVFNNLIKLSNKINEKTI